MSKCHQNMTFLDKYNSTTANSIVRDILLHNQTSRTIMSKHDHQRVALSKLVISKEHKKVKTLGKFANGIKEHVTGKLSLRAKLLIGGMDKVFKKIFDVREGERLLKVSHCCLYTTEGPITGLLFISTDKLAFCSDRSVVTLFCRQTGECLRFRYKVVIPLRKIDRAVQSESSSKKSKKYLQLITKDEFEFWFMGFVNCTKVCKCLDQAISPVHS